MDLTFLEHSSKVTPLLVRLYDAQKIKGLAKDNAPVAKYELIAAVSELVEMEISPRESELIADVLISLLRQAELEIRQALAERLASYENVPLRLLLQLANDDISVSGCVLKKSPILGDLDLIYIIKSQGPEHWKHIAMREQMSHQIMNMLAETGDMGTAIALAKNEHISLTEFVLTTLSDMAQESDDLALPLLRREEVPTELARRLYKYVGQEVKKYILAEYDIGESTIQQALEEVIVELRDASEPTGEHAPSATMLKAADRYKEKGLLTTKLMLGTLRRGQLPSFIAQFARFTNLSPKLVLEILVQPSGQGLAVVCKAFEMAKEDFVSIYLLTNRIRNKGRMVDLKDMTKALNYFNRIRPEVARGILKNSFEDTLQH